jgi:hypothetical protein
VIEKSSSGLSLPDRALQLMLGFVELGHGLHSALARTGKFFAG